MKDKNTKEGLLKILQAYRELFVGVNAEVVLADLKAVLHGDRTSVELDESGRVDSGKTLYNEGQRGAYLYILRIVENSKSKEYIESVLKAVEEQPNLTEEE